VAQPAPNNSSDEDEVEFIKQICGRPTKSGRLPRPSTKQVDDADALPGGLSKTSPSKRTKTSSPQTAAFSTGMTSPRETASVVSPRSASVSVASRVTSSKSARMPKTPAPKPPLTPSQSITRFSPSPYLSHMVSPLALNAYGAQSPGMLGINRLPSGVYVVLESPQGSLAGGDNANSNQQVLYHIFAEMSPAQQASPIASPGNGHLVAANSASPLIRPLHHTSGQLIRPLHSANQSADTQRVASPLLHPLHNAGLQAQNAGLHFRSAVGSPIRSPSPYSTAYAFVEPGAVHQTVSVGGVSHQGTSFFPRPQPFSPRYTSYVQGDNLGLSNASSTVGSIQDPKYTPVFAYPSAPATHNIVSSTAAIRAVNSSSWSQSATSQNLSMKSPPQELVNGKQLQISNSPAVSMGAIAKTSHSGAQLHQSIDNCRSVKRNASFEDDRLEQSVIATKQQDGTIVIMAEKLHQQHSGEPSRQHSDSQNQSSDRQVMSSSADTEEAGPSVATIRVIEHEDGTTELLIDGSLYSMDGVQLENNAVEDDDSQYIDVVVEHYPSNDSCLT